MSHRSGPNSNSSGSAWRRLLDGKRDELHRNGIEPSAVVTDEESFRSRFEGLCRDLKEPYGTTLLVKLHFHPIDALANAVEAAEQQYHPSLNTPLYLAPLIWGCIWVVIARACDTGVKHTSIINLLRELNRAVPQVGTDEPRLLQDPSVKASLLEIFDVYISSLLSVILNINLAQPLAPSSTKVDGIVIEAARKIRKEKDTYKQHLERATKHYQQQQQFASDSSSSNTRYGGHHSTPSLEPDTMDFLGRGSFGDVYKVRLFGQTMACKQIRIEAGHSAAARTAEQVENEVAIMKKLRHRHISLVHFHDDKHPGRHSIYMEPCADRNLGTYLNSCTESGYTAEVLRPILPWFGCLVDALACVHQCKIAHRDIKPSNILIKDGAVFLADFGVARDFSQHETIGTADNLLHGTPEYRAPEVHPGNLRGLPADIFSLGCVFSEMLSVVSGRSLGEYQEWRRVVNPDSPLAFRANLRMVRTWIAKVDDDSPLDFLSSRIIKPMLRDDPKTRPTAQQLWRSLVVAANEDSGSKFYCDLHYY